MLDVPILRDDIILTVLIIVYNILLATQSHLGELSAVENWLNRYKNKETN